MRETDRDRGWGGEGGSREGERERKILGKVKAAVGIAEAAVSAVIAERLEVFVGQVDDGPVAEPLAAHILAQVFQRQHLVCVCVRHVASLPETAPGVCVCVCVTLQVLQR